MTSRVRDHDSGSRIGTRHSQFGRCHFPIERTHTFRGGGGCERDGRVAAGRMFYSFTNNSAFPRSRMETERLPTSWTNLRIAIRVTITSLFFNKVRVLLIITRILRVLRWNASKEEMTQCICVTIWLMKRLLLWQTDLIKTYKIFIIKKIFLFNIIFNIIFILNFCEEFYALKKSKEAICYKVYMYQ